MAETKGETPDPALSGAEASETQASQPKAEAKKPEEGKSETPSQSLADLQKEIDAKNKVIENLRKVEDQAKKESKRLKELEDAEAQRQQAAMSEAERTAKRIQELEEQNAKQTALLKAKEHGELQTKVAKAVAKELALPFESVEALADRLRGETEEDLTADAKIVFALIPKPQEATSDTKIKKPILGPTNPGNGTKAETHAQKKNRILGTQQNPFSATDALERGGGVVISEKGE